MKAAPGDPVSIYLDPTISQYDVEIIRKNLGFDKPVIVQYFYWLKGVCMGDLGYSYVTGKPVLLAIFERLPATLLLITPPISVIRSILRVLIPPEI